MRIRIALLAALMSALTACGGNPFHQKYGAWSSDVLECTWVNSNYEMDLIVSRKPHTDNAQEARLFAAACTRIKPILRNARH